MRRRDFLVLPAALWFAPTTADDGSLLGDARVRGFIDDMRGRYGFDPAQLEDFFGRVSINEKVIELTTPPDSPRKKVYWNAYRKRRVSNQNVALGVRFFRRHEEVLRRAEAVYGVPARVIVAIIAVETRYGEHTGNYLVAEALATLAFAHPTRGEEFRRQLEHYLIYVREAKVNPLSIRGSYAGAFGIPQFLPQSVREYAVDFDEDGRTDLFSFADAIGSVGNFLVAHGWRRDREVSYPATAKGDARPVIEETARLLYKPTMTMADLRALGVGAEGAPEGDGRRYLFVDLENRYGYEYRLGTENFYALTRYNRSFKYAAVVTDMARAIEAAR